jgi:hypothetical protein
MLLVQNGQYVFQVVAGGANVVVQSPATANVWTHVAGVFDSVAGTISLYINGSLAAQKPVSGTLQQSSQPLWIGYWPSWNAFAGQIDEVWLSNQGLTQAQVQSLAVPLVGYWRFDDCSTASTTIADTSGNGHNGQRSAATTCGTGISGQDGVFNGTSGSVQIADNAAFHMTNAVTVGAWVNPTNITGLHTILNKWYTPDSYMLLIQNGQFVFRVAAGGTTFIAAAPATANVWTNVVGVFAMLPTPSRVLARQASVRLIAGTTGTTPGLTAPSSSIRLSAIRHCSALARQVAKRKLLAQIPTRARMQWRRSLLTRARRPSAIQLVPPGLTRRTPPMRMPTNAHGNSAPSVSRQTAPSTISLATDANG